MEEKLFVKCISSIINSNKPGYGFVSDFADCLLNISQEETSVSNIAVIWSYELGFLQKIRGCQYASFPNRCVEIGGRGFYL